MCQKRPQSNLVTWARIILQKKNFIRILIPIAPDLKSEIFKKTTNKKRLILNFK